MCCRNGYGSFAETVPVSLSLLLSLSFFSFFILKQTCNRSRHVPAYDGMLLLQSSSLGLPRSTILIHCRLGPM